MSTPDQDAPDTRSLKLEVEVPGAWMDERFPAG